MSVISWLKSLFSPKPAPREEPLGRNDLCWCGSGKKYKKCHLKADESHRYEAAYAARVAASRKGPAGGGKAPSKPLPPPS